MVQKIPVDVGLASTLAVSNQTFNLVQSTVGAWNPTFYDVTPDFSRSAAMTSLGSASLDVAAARCNACSRLLPLR